MTDPDRVLVALNPVRADRAGDFDDWLRTVLVPAITTHRAHLDGRWEILRSTEQADGLVTFAFILRGEEEHDWEILPLLTQALGQQGAEQALADMQAMMTGDQRSWFFQPLRPTTDGER